MAKIYETQSSIIFENNYTEFAISKANGTAEKIIDKKTGKDIKADIVAPFIALYTLENTSFSFKSLTLNGDVITAELENGKVELKALAFDNYFTFELLTALPEGTFRAELARMDYNYDHKNRANTGAVGVAMTIAANPVYFPNGYSKRTVFHVYPHLEDIGAKYGLIIAPMNENRDILKEVCLTIDTDKGICSTMGGAWSRDSRLGFTSYTIQGVANDEFLEKNIEYFKSMGVDQIDLHKGWNSFRQGDFTFKYYKNAQEFKEKYVRKLEENGMSAGLHTYSPYLDYYSSLLTDPKCQQGIKVNEVYTLADDITSDAMFVPTLESTDHVAEEFHDYMPEIPFLLIDEEIIKISKGKNGFKVVTRGHADTKITPHKKGAVIKYLEGFYDGFLPELGSELFLQIARNTAKAYNEGGFKMIYLDALDGIGHHTVHRDYWYYSAMFIREILKYCETPPLMENSCFVPSHWASRSRSGAWDVCRHGYKTYNELHAKENLEFVHSYNTPTLGWYHYYPLDDQRPGNYHVKYEHTDTVHHMGSIAVQYDYSTVFNGAGMVDYKTRYAGVGRNIDIYKKYDVLRKAEYFSEEYRQKLMDSPYETHLVEKRGGKFAFVEKSYQIAKFNDLNDTDRNTKLFKNPFGAQVPFIRIESLLSSFGNNPMVLLPLDESKELVGQNLSVSFGGYLDLSNILAKRVRIYGNGKGGKICIKTLSGPKNKAAHNYHGLIIDVDFTGWKEFTLAESDNGERTDHGFEANENAHYVYRSPYVPEKTHGIKVETEGDMNGVRMSSVTACEHIYDVLKNPTVKIGDMEIMFECELMSSDFIEFDGKEAKVIDRNGYSKPIWFKSNLKAPRGKFKATLTAKSLNRATPRAQLTLAFTGKEIK